MADAYAITSLRVGDVAWLTRYHSHRELSLHIRLWEDWAGQVVGWTYLRERGGFNLFVAPGQAGNGLLDSMLAEIDAQAQAGISAGDPPVSLYTYGVDVSRSPEDRVLAATLERHGFSEQPSTGGVLMRSLDDLPAPVLPPGYRLAWADTQKQILGRVEAQRAAFAPSDFTLDRYQRVRGRWPYRPELDRIILTDDGTVAAFCTAWLDEQNAAGLLEPVGTHPAHQRRGLARAVCLDAMHALRAAGARTAQVGFSTPAALATYASLGFTWIAADTVYRRDPH
ncbi:MAG: GNAT family N-acetyltransferase [Chloroflexota bacterium]